MYTCDNWVVIKYPDHYRVLVGTSGGYLQGSSWRMNSGITKVTEDGYYYYFHGASGSVYQCHKSSYCLRMNNAYVWEQLQKQMPGEVSIMPEDTDWLNMDWKI